MSEIVNLSDVCSEIFAGGDVPKTNYSIEKNDTYCIPIYTNGEKNNGLYGYTIEARVNEPSITVSARGTIGFTAIRDEPFYPAIRLITLIPNNKIDINYLYYVTTNYKFDKGGTSIPQLTVPMLKNYRFPLPSIIEQRIIVNKLDKVTALISLRKKQLEKLDELVKSRFIEMFGEPIDNPMGWDKTNISTVVGGKVSNGFFAKRDDYCDDGNVKVLGVANVVNRMYSNIEDLPTANGSETDITKYGVKYGDMLFCRSSLVAAGIGKASIVPRGTPNNVIFECHVIRLPLDLDKCVPEFMQALSTTDYFRNQVVSRSKTATMTTIGQDGILKTDIILPPLELQTQFAAFVAQTDKSKLAVQKSLEQLETLKKSLMQKYFG